MAVKLYVTGGSMLPTMVGATEDTVGQRGFVPTPEIGDNNKFLRGDGTWADAGDSATLNARIEELENKLDSLNPIQIISFTKNINSTYEIGSKIIDVTFAWKINKTPISVTLDGVEQTTDTEGSATLSGDITSYKKWVLKATDRKGVVATSDTSVSFYNGVYYGISKEVEIDNSFIQSLTKSLRSNNNLTFYVTPGAEEYIYFACPSFYNEPHFKMGGFNGGMQKVSELLYTNQSGYVELYTVYRSDEANLGYYDVVVTEV